MNMINTGKKKWFLGLVGSALLASSVAYAQASDRYDEAKATINKATALLNAIEAVNGSEAKQRDRALASLAAASKRIDCAKIRAAAPGAACP